MNYNTSQLIDDAIIQLFVSPIKCEDLYNAGLTPCTRFMWKGYKHGVDLVTHAFDEDAYYMDGQRLKDDITPPDYRLPAYSIKDVEKCLPPYLLTRNSDKIYEVSIDSIWQIESCKHSRLPDALAMMLRSCIQRCIVKVDVINEMKF